MMSEAVSSALTLWACVRGYTVITHNSCVSSNQARNWGVVLVQLVNRQAAQLPNCYPTMLYLTLQLSVH